MASDTRAMDSQQAFEARVKDQELFIRTFYGVYDESYIQYLWRKEARHLAAHSAPWSHERPGKDGSLTLLGAGLTFMAWRIRSAPRGDLKTMRKDDPSSSSPPGMDLVLKIPHSFTLDRLSPTFRLWKSLLLKCSDDIPLLPPFRILEGEQGFGVVMPFASEPLSQAKPHWWPLKARVAEFSQGLAERGLQLQDPLMTQMEASKLQGGCWRGTPFLYDLSELRQRGPRS